MSFCQTVPSAQYSQLPMCFLMPPSISIVLLLFSTANENINKKKKVSVQQEHITRQEFGEVQQTGATILFTVFHDSFLSHYEQENSTLSMLPHFYF